MEKHYVHYFVASNPDRSRQMLKYFWIPVILPLRFLRCVYWITYPGEFDYSDFWGAIFKFMAMVFTFIFVSRTKEWSDSARHKLGLFLLWMTRLFFLVAILEQSKRDRNANTFFAYVCLVCLGGFAVPMFSEYLALAIVISFVRPAQLLVSSSQNDSQIIQEIAYQHSLVLALCISIHWNVHSDLRRNWLRSPSKNFGPAVTGTSNNGKNGGGAAPAIEWDTLPDNYFSPTDHAELCAQALQVPSSPHAAWRASLHSRFRAARAGAGRHRGAAGRPARLRAEVAPRTERDRRRPGGPRLPGSRSEPRSESRSESHSESRSHSRAGSVSGTGDVTGKWRGRDRAMISM